MNTYTCTLECPNCGHQGAHDHVWDPEHEWAEPFLAECGGCEGLFVVESGPSPLSMALAAIDGHVHRITGVHPIGGHSADSTGDLMVRVTKAAASQWNEYVAHNPAYSGFAPATEGATQ